MVTWAGAFGRQRLQRQGAFELGWCALTWMGRPPAAGAAAGAAGADSAASRPAAWSKRASSPAVNARGVCSDMPSLPLAAVIPAPLANFSLDLSALMSAIGTAFGAAPQPVASS